MTYSQSDTCPKCGRHPRPTEPLPKWIQHIALCKGIAKGKKP